jgi:hypothetical protein
MKESILIHQIVGWTRLQIAFEGSYSWVVESHSKEKIDMALKYESSGHIFASSCQNALQHATLYSVSHTIKHSQIRGRGQGETSRKIRSPIDASSGGSSTWSQNHTLMDCVKKKTKDYITQYKRSSSNT